MDIITQATTRTINYTAIKGECLYNLVDTRQVDVSVIIPAHGRTQFNSIITQNFMDAIAFGTVGKTVSVTMVEHSATPEHKDMCVASPHPINYIWVPQRKGQRFNKCLAHNIGVLHSNRASNYLFHDIDTVVPQDFFIKLQMNAHGYDAIQAFAGRRLLHANEDISTAVLSGNQNINLFHPHHTHISIATAGAQGGSMYVSNEVFFKVGGFDDIFCTEYSVEDAFFYSKLAVMGKLGGADMPRIEMIHLHHPPSFDRTTKREDMHAYETFTDMSKADKLRYMSMRCEKLKEHYK